MYRKIGLKHYRFLLDDFGIWQHTKGKEIDKSMGYSLDDAARGLVVAALHGLKAEAKVLMHYIEKSLESDSNFFSADRKPIAFPISDDALGQAYWAMSLCFNRGIYADEALLLIEKIQQKINRISNVRGNIYAILGSSLHNSELTGRLIGFLEHEFLNESSKEWHWIEKQLCYGNAIIPLGFLTAAEKLNRPDIQKIGLGMLDFLNAETKHEGLPIAIGNKRWYPKDSIKCLYDQQPIDPAYQIMANAEAYRLTREIKYKREAEIYFSWFWGNNIGHKPLIDLGDESCRDGIQEHGLSKNRGSENIVCYLIAQEYMKSLEKPVAADLVPLVVLEEQKKSRPRIT